MKRKGVVVAKCLRDARLRMPVHSQQGMEAWRLFTENYRICFYGSLWKSPERIAEDSGRRGPFEFIVTNIPFDESVPIPLRVPKNEFYERVYGKSFECLDRIHAELPGAAIIAYTGADEMVCRKALEHHASHVVRKDGYCISRELEEIATAIERANR